MSIFLRKIDLILRFRFTPFGKMLLRPIFKGPVRLGWYCRELLVSNWSFEVELLQTLRMRFPGLVFLALLLTISGRLMAQGSNESATVDSGSPAGGAVQQGPELPQPGQPGSPFQVDHFWDHIALELAGGYSPVINRGVGYYGPGFTATVGAVYHVNARWAVLAEGQILGQHGGSTLAGCDESSEDCDTGTAASYIFSVQIAPVVYLRPQAATSPFVVGGVGYYHLGTHNVCESSDVGCDGSSDNPFNSDAVSVNAAGFNVGGGVRHRLSPYRKSEVYVDARYHYVASGSSSLGQVSVLPVSVGVRW